MMFTTGSCNKWMIMTKSAAIGAFYSGAQRQVLKSSSNANPYQATMYRRSGWNEDPWFQPGTAHSQATALYGEGNYNIAGGNGEGANNQGLNVYIRKV